MSAKQRAGCGGLGVVRRAVFTSAVLSVAFTPTAVSAAAREPTGALAIFAQCPRFTPKVNFCIYGQILAGEVTVGKVSMQIENPITLQGGYYRDEETGPVVEQFYGPPGGEALSKAPETIKGGLLGMPLHATLELAGQASEIGISTDSIVNQEGVGLSLPARLHLENTLLGRECYVGSRVRPLRLRFTTGKTSPEPPSKPLMGGLTYLDEYNTPFGILAEAGARLVENAFSVPEASGCGGHASALVDQLVDRQVGLPSPDGANAAVLLGSYKLATAENVIKSER